MDSTVEVAILKKLHFIKLEIFDSSPDSMTYSLNNHFDSKTLEIQCNSAERHNVNLRAMESVDGKWSKKVFSATIKRPLKNADDMCFTECDIVSTTGIVLGCISVQQCGLLAYNYEIEDSSKTALLQVLRRKVREGQIEFNIKSSENVVARINLQSGKIFLAMPPELDAAAKIRLICLMLLIDMTENRKESLENETIPPQIEAIPHASHSRVLIA